MAAFQLSKLSNDVVPMLNEGKVFLGFLLRPFVRMVCGSGFHKVFQGIFHYA